MKPQILFLDDSIASNDDGVVEYDLNPAVDNVVHCRQKLKINIGKQQFGNGYIDDLDAIAGSEAITFAFFAKNTYCKWRPDMYDHTIKRSEASESSSPS